MEYKIKLRICWNIKYIKLQCALKKKKKSKIILEHSHHFLSIQIENHLNPKHSSNQDSRQVGNPSLAPLFKPRKTFLLVDLLGKWFKFRICNFTTNFVLCFGQRNYQLALMLNPTNIPKEKTHYAQWRCKL